MGQVASIPVEPIRRLANPDPLWPPRRWAVATAVEAVLSVPEERLDFAEAKLALDEIVDPSLDSSWTRRELDRLTALARKMAGEAADAGARLGALRILLYGSGPWNGRRPFAYDHAHPDGTFLPQKLLAVYLAGRLGNCVSMPVLFLILGTRLGLDLSLAAAPLHLFVRWRAGEGHVLNLETTSGAHPARDAWFRRHMPMSGRALKNGLYMRSLSPREAVAAMATTVLEHLMEERRLEEAIAVADVILEAAPRDVQTMVAAASACGILLEQIRSRYPSAFLMPPLVRAQLAALARRNAASFAAAEELGWEPLE